jgi:hypothetical protein
MVILMIDKFLLLDRNENGLYEMEPVPGQGHIFIRLALLRRSSACTACVGLTATKAPVKAIILIVCVVS